MTNPLDKIIRGVVKSARPASGRVPDLVSKISGLSQVPAPQDEALRLAQQRAALPVKKGGLGLPANNTAAQRADVMFPVNAYHGTADDIAAFDLSQSGRHLTKDWGNAVSLSPSSSNAEYYAVNAGSAPEKNAAFARYEANPTNEALIEFRKAARLAEINPTGANIMPLRLDASRSEDYLVQSGRNDPFLYQNSRMKENKKDVAKILDNPNVISEYAVYNPDKIRSRFAAFDPFRRTAAIAAAMGVAAPDLLAAEPEKKAKGGAVSQDAMNLSVMNQKVQRKMGGGGAKSKNAPKFTEAITQGLGPMLYGAARGTAAGLAGIGGDIEELARLGINYAGDKLQGRFPNMLDKRDVVSPKATLPTSELVLSKIPSLKDFGAGPEARHSEDIAAKLGMYGLSNIAAPKAGKAVVQGVNATGKALAPKAGEMLENYMVRTGGILPMDVWHGSPHRFPPTAKNPLGEFDASKIGTGEGAQAYGYGHYSAEVRDLAKTYQPRSPLHEEKLIKEYNRAEVKRNYPKMEVLEDALLHKSPDEILAKFSNIEDGYTPEHAKAANEYLLWLGKNQPEVGALYKVDLPDAQIAKMLDWDKPLGGQHPDVQAALAKIDKDTYHPQGWDYGADEQGQMIYMRLANSPLAKTYADASELLRSAGIPGIKYLDQGSRAGGKGTSNFVVFPGNEEMLNILSREKDGGLVHGKKNGGEAKKPFSNDFERRQQMAGSVMPSQREMEEALRPATVNSLLKRAADRRQGKAMQEEPESPEVIPEGEVRPYEPVFRQNKSANIQQGLESLGFPIPRARSIAQNIMGEGGTGIADVVPFVGTPMSLQETKRNIERARDKGDQTGVATELGLGALTAAGGLWGTKALTKTLASSIKKSPYQRYSQAEFDRILREGELKQLPAPPAPPKLLNGPTEQLLLNAPKREKTVFEMQQELAQKHAMLPKSQYGLELPPGNTAAQRLEAMGFDTPAYHSTKQDPKVLLPRPPASSRRGTDFGVHVGLNPDTANGAIIPPWYEKTMRDQATRADLPASIRGESLKDIENYYKDSQVMPLLVNTGKSLEMPDLGRWDSPNNMLHNIGASSGVWPNYSLKKGVKTNDPDALNELIKNAGQAEGEKLFSEVKDELHKKAIEDMLRKRGYGSIAYPNTVEGKGDISLMLTDPDRLRSRFAAGDPFRRNAAVAAATGMAAPDLLAEEYANGGEVTSDDLILIERRR